MVNEQSVLRIALYGGAFDPVHNAHLRVARYALKQAGLDRVIFVPSAQSPLKANPPVASDEERVEMLELATAGEARFKVDSFEVEQGGTSYTIESAKYFHECYPASDLFWLVGADQFEQLDRWRAIDELVELVSFMVLGRPGSTLVPCKIENLHYMVIDAPLMEENSSEIRQLCEQGQPVTGLVADSVEAFISEQGLYTSRK
jgi:nicotinate-nucleotide adenylyltransferase